MSLFCGYCSLMETDTNGFEGFDLWKPLASEETVFLASVRSCV